MYLLTDDAVQASRFSVLYIPTYLYISIHFSSFRLSFYPLNSFSLSTVCVTVQGYDMNGKLVLQLHLNTRKTYFKMKLCHYLGLRKEIFPPSLTV